MTLNYVGHHPTIRLQVGSEVGRLRQVLLHCPGSELELVSPDHTGAFLLEDLLFVEEAAREHAALSDLLRALGVETLDLTTLLARSLPAECGPHTDWRMPVPDRWDIEALIGATVRIQHHALSDVDSAAAERRCDWLQQALRERWAMGGADGLASALISGLAADETSLDAAEAALLLPPLPNMMFMRDPAAVVGGGVVLAAPASRARRREALLLSWIIRSLSQLLPDDAAPPIWLNPLATPLAPLGDLTIEGGDLLVVSEQIVLLGLSERTSEAALSTLARRLLADPRSSVRTIYGVRLPHRRSMMHLDTVFTMLSEREYLLYPPAFFGPEAGPALRLTSDGVSGLQLEECPDFFAALQHDLRASTGIEDLLLSPIACGGSDPLAQEREQWSDGANMVAVGPGVVIGYDRNDATFAALEAHGYHCVTAAQVCADPVLLAAIRWTLDTPCDTESGTRRQRYAIAIPSAELSRARGGPRCLTMPLLREQLCWQHGAILGHPPLTQI